LQARPVSIAGHYTYEQARNAQGLYAEQAARLLGEKRLGLETFALLWYSASLPVSAIEAYYAAPSARRESVVRAMAGAAGTGVPMLPPGHVQERSKRWAAKIFLTHWHECAWVVRHGRLPVKPFALERLGHQHWIAPMHMELIPGWAELRYAAMAQEPNGRRKS
jgi:hypothetical protein